ncbi:hypothetical protein KUCAC02_015293, partial [Chaenocephalus aceratus]
AEASGGSWAINQESQQRAPRKERCAVLTLYLEKRFTERRPKYSCQGPVAWISLLE